MKLTDLLVRIANNEEIPNKIKFMEMNWEKCDIGDDYYCESLGKFLSDYVDFSVLNYKVEIIEDKFKSDKE